MIELKNEKTKQKIRVNTMVQAKPFIRAGYKVVGDDSDKKASVIPKMEAKPEYKKSDIARMNVEDLKKLAVELGIEGAEESTGDVLKAEIIKKLEL